ncbi:glycosyltransferase family 2 protein [Aurantiacibacter poecillastricola]|uniref:glycosyltransferase family 2 protein n=1 Tax=Aurantiacibacter poecillastricola TaxID=3064385 RepID=UPI00273EDD93|nr:glycosyltransferase family A protein [Aurantiacibacter sp. 219JJ12-13]MDP5262590.1 glycosyltransferase family A protein [Aurantiacibacter sp. 219JJ12-13]
MNDPLVTLVLAYFNEEDFIGATLASLLAQTDRRFALLLVDNMSSDGSEQRVLEALAGNRDIPVIMMKEKEKGQLHALRRGLCESRTPYVATLDADTFYPPDYVEKAISMLESDPSISTAMAFNVGESGRRRASAFQWFSARFWPAKCHAGGAGHCYRRSMLERAGGFDASIWPFVLFDHEIAHRIRKHGRFAYRRDHVIHASERRGDRSSSWNMIERLLYRFLPRQRMDWFFYEFLGPRFERRKLNSVALRKGRWRSEP